MRAPAPDLSPTGIASAAGHALNNVLAYLYAASSYLDDGDVDAARARTAIEDACHGARSLSAALSLLGMTRDNVADVPAFGHVIDATTLDRALEAIGETLAVAGGAPDFDRGAYATTLDGDTIGAILLCGATALRRSAGVSSVLRLGLAMVPAADPGACRLAIRLRATLPSGASAPYRTSHGPCELALSHVAPILPALDAALVQGADGAIELVFDLRAPADAPGTSGARR